METSTVEVLLSDQMPLVATAMFGLILGGTATWLALAVHRRAALAFLEQAFEATRQSLSRLPHGRCVTFQMAEVAIPRTVFAETCA